MALTGPQLLLQEGDLLTQGVDAVQLTEGVSQQAAGVREPVLQRPQGQAMQWGQHQLQLLWARPRDPLCPTRLLGNSVASKGSAGPRMSTRGSVCARRAGCMGRRTPRERAGQWSSKPGVPGQRSWGGRPELPRGHQADSPIERPQGQREGWPGPGFRHSAARGGTAKLGPSFLGPLPRNPTITPRVCTTPQETPGGRASPAPTRLPLTAASGLPPPRRCPCLGRSPP